MLKKGSPVIVKDAWKYNGRFLGCVGIIHHFYTSRGRMAGPQVAILFEDVKNPESSDGLFWFPADNIVLASSYSKNKLAQQTKNYMTEEVNINDMKAQLFGGKTARIRFLNGTNQNKTYEYALYDDFKAGDTVVVQTGHHGKTVAVIDEVIDQHPINVAYNREVICLVDMTAYEERQRRVQRMRELKAQMDDRVRQLRNIAIYEMMATRDSTMRELLDEFNALGLHTGTGQTSAPVQDDMSEYDATGFATDDPADNE